MFVLGAHHVYTPISALVKSKVAQHYISENISIAPWLLGASQNVRETRSAASNWAAEE